ncbi:hypothetical protein [Bacillus atrophaeus]|uniref:hypothetical protein n=1 Tax=Bacillus atrophaeus TaxID=1452 RepID=UPI00215A07A1|nr:hypothetical protein [Bacillus atrophaeus]
MEGRLPVSISLAKSRAAIMAAKNALFTSWSAVMYPIIDGRRNNARFAFTAAAVI